MDIAGLISKHPMSIFFGVQSMGHEMRTRDNVSRAPFTSSHRETFAFKPLVPSINGYGTQTSVWKVGEKLLFGDRRQRREDAHAAVPIVFLM